MTLNNMAMPDGSICFYTPEIDMRPAELRRMIGNVAGVKIIGSIDCDAQESCWFEFEYIEERFKIHNPYPSNSYWFIVENPDCSTKILAGFVGDFERLLGEL